MASYQSRCASEEAHPLEGYASERAPLVSSEATHELDEYHGGLLPFQSDSQRHIAPDGPDFLGSIHYRWQRLVVLTYLVFGTFLASCPIPRKTLLHPIRVFLINLVAILVTSTPSRRANSKSRESLRRAAVAYLGFFLSMYAIFGAADEVHIETRWQSLLWYSNYDSFKLGLLTRWILLFSGYRIQRFAGVHARNRILASYLLSLFWVYVDTPTTFFDHARGRTHW